MSFVGEDHRFEKKLEEASRYLMASPDEIVSFKIRPIEDEGVRHDRYVYPVEYEQIKQLLARYKLLEEGYVSGGEALLYETEDGHKLLFVSHETGPEIIVLIRDVAVTVGAAAVAGQHLVKLINLICEIIRKEADSKNRGKKSGRYYGAKAISLEKRLSTGAKILKQLKITADASTKAINSLKELWKSV